MVKGGPFRLLENSVCCKISKKMKGDPLETSKNFLKNLTVQKKIGSWDPLVSFGFVCSVEKRKKNEGGPFALRFRWPDMTGLVV